MKEKSFLIIAICLLAAVVVIVGFSDYPVVEDHLPGAEYFQGTKHSLLDGLDYILGTETFVEAEPVAEEEEYRISVPVSPVEYRDLERTLEHYGSFTYDESVEVSAPRQGRIEAMFVDEIGDTVSVGDPIAVLQHTSLQIELRKALNALRQRQVEKQQAFSRLATLRTEIDRANTDLESSREELRYVLREYDRGLRLYYIDAFTDRELTEIAEDRFRAVADVLRNKIGLLQLHQQLQEVVEDIELAQAEIEQAESTIEQVRHELEESVIRAPIDGIVAEKEASTGEILEAGESTLVQLMDIDDIILVVQLPEHEIVNITPGQPVRVSPDAYPDNNLEGVVHNVEPLVDPRARNFNVRVRVSNEDHRLKPGMFAHAEFILDRDRNVLAVPENALMETPVPGDYDRQVYVVRDGVAISREISIADGDDHYAQVLDGLQPGDLVVVDDQDRLRDFMEVETELVEE